MVVIVRDLDTEELRAAMPGAPVRLTELHERRPLACAPAWPARRRPGALAAGSSRARPETRGRRWAVDLATGAFGVLAAFDPTGRVRVNAPHHCRTGES